MQSYNDNLEQALGEEVIRLKNNIAELVSTIKIISLELEKAEEALEIFLNDYYSSVGPLVERIKNHSAHKESLGQLDYHLEVTTDNQEDPLIRDKEYNEIVEQEIKVLYRKLVLLCHPDAVGNKNNEVENFTLINNAYAKKDLAELVRLEHNLTSHSKPINLNLKEELNYLLQEYELLQNNLIFLKEKKSKLITSPAYILQKQVIIKKIEGDDLIAKIKQNLINQLSLIDSEL